MSPWWLRPTAEGASNEAESEPKKPAEKPSADKPSAAAPSDGGPSADALSAEAASAPASAQPAPPAATELPPTRWVGEEAPALTSTPPPLPTSYSTALPAPEPAMPAMPAVPAATVPEPHFTPAEPETFTPRTAPMPAYDDEPNEQDELFPADEAEDDDEDDEESDLREAAAEAGAEVSPATQA